MAAYVTLEKQFGHASEETRRDALARVEFYRRHDARSEVVIDNLYAERLVSAATWDALIGALAVADLTPRAIEQAVIDTFRPHTLTGKTASVPAKTVLGRLFKIDALARRALRLHKGSVCGFATVKSARNALRKENLDLFRKCWGSRTLTPFVMWGFFQPGNAPLSGLAYDHSLCGFLGLPKDYVDSDLVLLQYLLPDNLTPYIPRVIEAYAGDVWNWSFKVPSDDDISNGHGRTRVWDEHREAGKRGLPEVVHKRIVGSYVTIRPKVVRRVDVP